MRKNAFLLMLKNFGDLSPEKTSTPRLTSRDMNHILMSQGETAADSSIMETLFLRVMLLLL